MNDLSNKFFETNAAIGTSIATGLIVASAILGFALYYSRATSGSVNVIGQAKRQVTADTAKWSGIFRYTTPGDKLKNGYAKMTKNKQIITDFFTSHGIPQEDISFTPTQFNQPFRDDAKLPKETTFKVWFEINSRNIDKVGKAADDINKLIDYNIEIETSSIDYYYSKLQDLRVNLLTEAMKDAQIRANKIVEATNQRVKRVINANAGSIQILPINSNGSDAYANTSTNLQQQIVINIHATFSVR